MSRLRELSVAAAVTLALPVAGLAQSAANMAALQGLAPVSALLNTPQGKAALSANYTITGAIQHGSLKQPTLLPFALQQQQALKDAFITSGNASELADGLGTKLGSVYQSLAHYQGPKAFTSVSPALETLFAYSNQTTGSDSNFSKYFFASQTADGETPVSAAAAAILAAADGVTDVYGRAYGVPAGSAGADPYGNSRAFQTEPSLARITGDDYFGAPSSNMAYLAGPSQDLTASPSFPSGHATYGYMEAVLLGILTPQRYPQEVTRAAEYGNSRIILGAHYAMDVIAGRTLALHDAAHLLANDPAYVGQPGTRAPRSPTTKPPWQPPAPTSMPPCNQDAAAWWRPAPGRMRAGSAIRRRTRPSTRPRRPTACPWRRPAPPARWRISPRSRRRRDTC